jgi:hypothetical protein
MNRRHFVSGGIAAMSSASGAGNAQSTPRTRYYLLETYFLRNSTQLPRLHEFMSQHYLPAVHKLHPGPKIFLEALVAAHMPQYATVQGFSSLEEISSLPGRLASDAGYRKAFADWENGADPPFENLTRTVLKATDYSPEIVPAKHDKPRIFELRVYHSPTWRQLSALHERFAGPEIKIFQRVGVHPVLYTETLVGPKMPNLTYLIPFDSLAAREKAWDAFGSDPEWVKVRKESIDRHGQISSVIEITLYRATAYSPVG